MLETDTEGQGRVGLEAHSTDDTARERHAVGLVERSRRGDKKALLELHDLYAAPIFAFLGEALGDLREAEEALHEVFAGVLVAPTTQLSERLPVGAWLLRIAHAEVQALEEERHDASADVA